MNTKANTLTNIHAPKSGLSLQDLRLYLGWQLTSLIQSRVEILKTTLCQTRFGETLFLLQWNGVKQGSKNWFDTIER